MEELRQLSEALRDYRRACGLSQEALANRLQVTDRTIRNTECGRQPVTAAYLRKWIAWARSRTGSEATVHRVEELFQWYNRSNTLNIELWWPEEWGTLGERSFNLEQDEEPMKRRALLTGGLGFPAGAALEAAEPPITKDYEYSSAALRRAYQRLPAHLLQPRVKSELDSLDHELAGADGETLTNLLVPFGELHLLASWMARWDLLDEPAAARHRRTAALAARQAGDADLLAHVLITHSLVCLMDGRRSEAVEAADEACRIAPSSRPASVSYMQIAASEAAGRAGQPAKALEHLDTARSVIVKVKPGSSWRGTGVWNSRSMVKFEANVLRALGRPADAHDVLRSAPAWPDSSAKHAVVQAADLAQVLFDMGEVEAAATQATTTYQLAQQIQHGDTQRGLRQLYLRLTTYDTPAVRNLGELLHA